MNDQSASATCDRCGYAVGVRRVTLLVQEQPARFHKFCAGCLTDFLEQARPLSAGRRAAA